MNRVPPELIGLDNAMEDFWAEYRRKQNLAATDEAAMRQRWIDAHIAAFPEAYRKEVVKPKPWKLKAALAGSAIVFFWWEVGEYILRWAR